VGTRIWGGSRFDEQSATPAEVAQREQIAKRIKLAYARAVGAQGEVAGRPMEKIYRLLAIRTDMLVGRSSSRNRAIP